MRFISYSQNREDVLLWRALSHIGKGFYIDVGANDTVDDSVTKAFYDRGWHGINIEPLPVYQQRLREMRPRDLNLAIAAGANNGELTLYDVPAVRGWATSDQAVAEQHRSNGFEIETVIVPVRRLADLCDEHVSGEIHFLKIDVEGFEAEVLRGMDFEKWRPWVVVVEATLPGSKVSNHAAWEHVFTDHRYLFAHFDGLNRFYVAQEHAELLEKFATPPNVFDEYDFVGQTNAENEAQSVIAQLRERDHALALAHARGEMAEAKAQLANHLARQAENAEQNAIAREQQARHATTLAESQIHLVMAQELQARSAALHAENATHEIALRLEALHLQLHAVYRSKSWRITAPIRWVISTLMELRANGPKAARNGAKAIARQTFHWLQKSRLARTTARGLVGKFPAVESRLRRVTARFAPPAPVEYAVMDVPPQPARHHAVPLPARAKMVLLDIQRACTNLER